MEDSMEDNNSLSRKRQLQEISTENNGRERKLKFRNYQPRDKSLLEKCIGGGGVAGDRSDSNSRTENKADVANQDNSNPTITSRKTKDVKSTAEDQQSLPIKENIILKELESLRKQQVGGPDSINIAPKKINWDLKNQVQNKIDKLKRRTQRAIVEILREKLSQMEDSGDESD